MQSFWRGKSQSIAGCKREHIQKIVKIAFGIREEKNRNLGMEINSYTFQELYLYYCYIERIAKVDTCFSKILMESCQRKNKTAIQKIEERQVQKENLEKEINEMSKEEKWRYEIFDRQQDILYYQNLADSDTYSTEDKIIIAELLKEYWISSRKWEGDRVSKKQVIKISKIKEILKTV